MQCEICGKNFSTGKKVEIDGTLMLACADCANFGEAKEEIMPVVREKPRKGYGAGNAWNARPSRPAFVPSPKTLDAQFDFGLDLASDYGVRIRHAREKKGLTIEDLGLAIYAPVSEIRRIESQSLKPGDVRIKKLESCLGISLREKNSGASGPEKKAVAVESDKNTDYSEQRRAFTLADMIKKKADENAAEKEK